MIQMSTWTKDEIPWLRNKFKLENTTSFLILEHSCRFSKNALLPFSNTKYIVRKPKKPVSKSISRDHIHIPKKFNIQSSKDAMVMLLEVFK